MTSAYFPRTQAAIEADHKAVRRIANRTHSRVREMMKPGPITIIKGDGTRIVQAVEDKPEPTMPKPRVLLSQQPTPIANYAANAETAGLVPEGTYADLVNDLAAEGA